MNIENAVVPAAFSCNMSGVCLCVVSCTVEPCCFCTVSQKTSEQNCDMWNFLWKKWRRRALSSSNAKLITGYCIRCKGPIFKEYFRIFVFIQCSRWICLFCKDNNLHNAAYSALCLRPPPKCCVLVFLLIYYWAFHMFGRRHSTWLQSYRCHLWRHIRLIFQCVLGPKWI